MSVVPIKEFVIETLGNDTRGRLNAFDSTNFPDVLLINETVGHQSDLNYSLFDTQKQKIIYKFPPLKKLTDGYGCYTVMFSIPPNDGNITANYNFRKQSLIYITRNPGNKCMFESHKLSYTGFKFKCVKINSFEIANLTPHGTVKLEKNFILITTTDRLIIINLLNFEITAEFIGSSHIKPLSCPNTGWSNSTPQVDPPNIIFLGSGTPYVITIYDYVNNIVLDNVCVEDGSPNVTKLENNYIIGKSFYTFKKEDDILPENKCVICFSGTHKKNVLVPCGHTQFCAKCIKTDFKTCPICRCDIEKVIKIYN